MSDALLSVLQKNNGQSPFLLIPDSQIKTHFFSSVENNAYYEKDLLDIFLAIDQTFRPAGLSISLDSAMEAESLGCKLNWSQDSEPEVVSHPLENTMNVPCCCTLPRASSGRFPFLLQLIQHFKQASNQNTSLFAMVRAPFSLAYDLRGKNLMDDFSEDEEFARELLDYCTEGAKRVSKLFSQNQVDGVIISDPNLSCIESDLFDRFLLKPYSDLFSYIRQTLQIFSVFSAGSDACFFKESICHTAPDAWMFKDLPSLQDASAACEAGSITPILSLTNSEQLLNCSENEIQSKLQEYRRSLTGVKNLIFALG